MQSIGCSTDNSRVSRMLSVRIGAVTRRTGWCSFAGALLIALPTSGTAQAISGRESAHSLASAMHESATVPPDRAAASETVPSPASRAAGAPGGVMDHAPDLAVRITVHFDHVALRNVIEEVARQARLRVAFGRDVQAAAQRVTLTAADVPASEVIARALAGTTIRYTVSASGQLVFTDSAAEPDPFPAPEPGAVRAEATIRGRVSDLGSGAPIPGAQVSIAATHQGGLTDDNGAYTIARVAAGTVLLRAQRIGFEPQERSIVVPESGVVTANFAMKHTSTVLTGVVVTATGQERRREIGNAISTVDAADVAHAPVADAQDIISGRIPGATVLTNSGQPGAGGTIRLRGVNSISQGNSPIIYVDGVRIYNGTTPVSASSRQSTLPLNDIDASEIDHIEVVKGPAATTLYGTEASGGVIQIFTKHGLTGKPTWDAEVARGFNYMGHVGPASDPTGLFINQCRGSGLVTSAGVTFEDPSCPASGTWLQHGLVERYALGVRGGGKDLTYYVAGNVSDEKGVLPAGGSHDAGFRTNLGFRPAKPLSVTLSSSYTRRKVDWVPDGDNSNSFLLNVSRGVGSNFKGSGCSSSSVICLANDSLFNLASFTASDHFITGLTANFDPVASLNNRVSLGFDYDNVDLENDAPYGYLNRTPLGQLLVTQWVSELLSVDYASTFRHPFGESVTTATSWGGQLFDRRNSSVSLESDNFAAPGSVTLTSGSTRTITDALKQRVINGGLFAQEVLGIGDRLFITGGLRVDGNSAFGKSFGLQSYPKIAASYLISDQGFWPSHLISTMKLRAALGESGKAPGAFDAVRTWISAPAENGQPAFTPSQVGNPNLGPERTRETEVGFDMTAIDNRLTVDFSYYRQHTYGALIPVTLPPSEGFSNRQLENVGELFNRGVDLGLGLDILRLNDLHWQARLNVTKVHSEAGNLGGQTITISAVQRSYVQQGLPVPAYIGKAVTNPDAFAAPVIVDNTYLGSEFPTLILNPGTTIRFFNRFTFDALAEIQRGGHLLNATGYQNSGQGVWQPCYATQAALNKAKAGDATALNGITAFQRAKCSQDASIRDYAFWVESSDFFKLRSVSLTYDIPTRFIPGHMRSASFTVAGTNLFTSTRYDGVDPQVTDQGDNTFSRREYYNFPSYRTFLATLRVGF